MIKLKWFALALMTIIGSTIPAPYCFAQTQCPWLNAATAGGVLGGEVQASITNATTLGDATCHFTRKQDSANLSITIDVHTMALPSKDFPTFTSQCGGTLSPLKAIGNEAFQCVSKNTSASGEEQVIGRVRDRAFILTVNANATKQPTPARTSLTPETRNLAEQVAGSLF